MEAEPEAGAEPEAEAEAEAEMEAGTGKDAGAVDDGTLVVSLASDAGAGASEGDEAHVWGAARAAQLPDGRA